MVLLPPPVCAVDGCDRPVKARGWCNMHYRRWTNHGDPLLVRGEREEATPTRTPIHAPCWDDSQRWDTPPATVRERIG